MVLDLKRADRGLSRRLHIVDVFTDAPFLGNPVAVVLDAEGLTTGEMQRIANWTNLSETTFVLPAPDNIFDSEGRAPDYSLRIFTPRAELPFAGHPTIGSAHAVLEAGVATPTDGMLIQHCAKGLIEIAVPADCEQSGISFRLPAHSLTPAPEPEILHRAFGAAAPFARLPAIVDVGPRWLIAEYPDEASVRSLQPDMQVLADYDRRHGTTGATIFAELNGRAMRDGSSSPRLVVRSFAPADGIAEDPVCGSGNGAVAACRLDHGAAEVGDHYTASQGREVGRDGLVQIVYGADGIHVGGRTVTCVTGYIR